MSDADYETIDGSTSFYDNIEGMNNPENTEKTGVDDHDQKQSGKSIQDHTDTDLGNYSEMMNNSHVNDGQEQGFDEKYLDSHLGGDASSSSLFSHRPEDSSTNIDSKGKNDLTEKTNEGQSNTTGLEGSGQDDKPNDSGEEYSEYNDVMVNDTMVTLDRSLENSRVWTKKLLREITMYVEMLGASRIEYEKVQKLEHEESQRLDQVQPDVQRMQDATAMNPELGAASFVPGSKRPRSP